MRQSVGIGIVGHVRYPVANLLRVQGITAVSVSGQEIPDYLRIHGVGAVRKIVDNLRLQHFVQSLGVSLQGGAVRIQAGSLIQIQLVKADGCLAILNRTDDRHLGCFPVQGVSLRALGDLEACPVIHNSGIRGCLRGSGVHAFHIVQHGVNGILIVGKAHGNLVVLPDSHVQQPESGFLPVHNLLQRSVVHILHINLVPGDGLGASVPLLAGEGVIAQLILQKILCVVYRKLPDADTVDFCPSEEMCLKMPHAEHVYTGQQQNQQDKEHNHAYQIFG